MTFGRGLLPYNQELRMCFVFLKVFLEKQQQQQRQQIAHKTYSVDTPALSRTSRWSLAPSCPLDHSRCPRKRDCKPASQFKS